MGTDYRVYTAKKSEFFPELEKFRKQGKLKNLMTKEQFRKHLIEEASWMLDEKSFYTKFRRFLLRRSNYPSSEELNKKYKHYRKDHTVFEFFIDFKRSHKLKSSEIVRDIGHAITNLVFDEHDWLTAHLTGWLLGVYYIKPIGAKIIELCNNEFKSDKSSNGCRFLKELFVKAKKRGDDLFILEQSY